VGFFFSMVKSQKVQHLRTLNNLLTAIHTQEHESSGEIAKAVDFFINELLSGGNEGCDYPAMAQGILEIHSSKLQNAGLRFWCISEHEGDELWLRATFLEHLQHLRGFPHSTLVIYGLHETVSPDQHYWTQKAQRNFESLRDYLEKLAVDYHNPGHTLNLMFI
jgi:hypothetical protein